ncbi:hypothetical protein Pint_18637 [Pistacia integerrima]|uniref:Uncharacterized protein n=1 Tax=Pistacia integerrima TaxID=434235 RepID=A0ACC0YUJ9_9ROSI|nr:hypothetical protein Pint_18637 [Pistacia integerrima]
MDDWDDNQGWEADDNFEFFEKYYHCYSFSRVDKLHLESGNKIIMPQSALHRLEYTNVKYPLEFELSNLRSGKITHCGVLEFTAEDGFIYVPTWMMEVMKIQEYDSIKLKNVSLMKAVQMKLQPHTQDFLKLSNPKALLETSLRNFSCLTTGDTIMIVHDNKKLYINILETKPSPAVFKQQAIVEEEEKVKAFIPFSGKARRLDGMPRSGQNEKELLAAEGKGKSTCAEAPEPRKAGGKLVFDSRSGKEKAEASVKEDTKREETVKSTEKFQSFTGKSFRLTR